MPTDSLGQGIPYLDYSDKPDLKVLGEGIVTGLTPRANLIFQTASERDATLPSPTAGMECWLADPRLKCLYDGTQWVVVASGASRWTTPHLASGYTPNGNDNGTPQYKVINEGGDYEVMWRGAIGVTFEGGYPVNDGHFLQAALPSAVRPTTRRTVTAACSAIHSEGLSVKIDFNSNGTVAIISHGGMQPPWISLNNIRYSL